MTEPPIRVGSDGTVAAAVPLYLDPTSGNTTSGAVSLTLIQGAQSSNSVSLTIQDLPSVSSYGLLPGQISEAFLNFEQMLLGSRIMELEALDILPGNSVDPTQTISDLQTLLDDTIAARTDIDSVMLDNTTILPAGTLPDGTALQFDHNSLDMMDRTFAVYLTELAPIISNPPTAAHSSGRSQAQPAVSLGSVITSLKSINNVVGIVGSLQTAANANSLFDYPLAVAEGFGGLFGLANVVTGDKAAGQVSSALGAITSSFNVLQDFANEATDLGFIWCVSSQMSLCSGIPNDPATMSQAYGEISSLSTKAYADTVNAELELAEFGVGFEAFPTSVISVLESNTGKISMQSGELLLGLYKLATAGGEASDYSTAVSAGGQVPSPFPTNTQGFAQLNETVDVTYMGSGTPPLSGLDFCCFEDNPDLSINGICDPSGNCLLFVPLQAPSTDYSNLTLSLVNPLSNYILDSETVDLSSVNTSTPVEPPEMTGTCDNTDVSNQCAPPAFVFTAPAQLISVPAGSTYSYYFCEPPPAAGQLCGTAALPATNPNGGNPPYTFTTEGSLPSGLSGLMLNSQTGQLSGTPDSTDAGNTTSFTICATDLSGHEVCQPTSLYVGAETGTYTVNFTGSVTDWGPPCDGSSWVTVPVTGTGTYQFSNYDPRTIDGDTFYSMSYNVTGSITLSEGAGLCIDEVSGNYNCIEDGGSLCGASDLPTLYGEPAETRIFLVGAITTADVIMEGNFNQAPVDGNTASGSGTCGTLAALGGGTWTMAPASP